MSDSLDDELWKMVRAIPPGRVMNYGQIADCLADQDLAALTARQVGRKMATAPDDVPWHRVVNSQGKCSVDSETDPVQQRLLESEGVEFSSQRLAIKRYRWNP